MIQEIIKYNEILENIPTFINESPYKKNYIIEKIGMKSATFYRKMKNLEFSPTEMMNIAKIIRPEEYSLYELKKSIMEAKNDYKEGRVRDHKDVMEEIKKEFLNK